MTRCLLFTYHTYDSLKDMLSHTNYLHRMCTAYSQSKHKSHVSVCLIELLVNYLTAYDTSYLSIIQYIFTLYKFLQSCKNSWKNAPGNACVVLVSKCMLRLYSWYSAYGVVARNSCLNHFSHLAEVNIRLLKNSSLYVDRLSTKKRVGCM